VTDVATDVMTDVYRQLGVTSRWVGCNQRHRDGSPCGTEWTQVLFMGQWTPGCPTCVPQRASLPRPAAQLVTSERPAYTGDILEDLRSAGVNVRKYGGATMAAVRDSADPWSVANNDQHAVAAADAWLAAWRAARTQRYAPVDWMYCYGAASGYEPARPAHERIRLGNLGNGKTYLCIAMARDLIESGDLAPTRYRFVTAEALLLEAEATFRGDDQTEDRMIRRYAGYDLLHIDDLGVRSEPKNHALRIIGEIMDKRLAHGTLITSNLSIATIQEAMPAMARVTDRITGECGDGGRYVIPFRSASRRQRRVTEGARS
jgi:hypothetical protein